LSGERPASLLGLTFGDPRNDDVLSPDGAPQTYLTYQFYANAVTLEDSYFVSRTMTPSEELLWSHALQLLTAIHAIHNAGEAVHFLEASNVLLTDRHTVRLSSIGLFDLAMMDAPKSVQQAQAEDLLALGRLLLCIACQSPTAATPTAVNKSMAYVCASFSSDLQHLLLLLLSNPKGGYPTVHDAVALCSGRLATQMAQTQHYADSLQHELSKEMENGRLLRLLAKLSFVKDRPVLGDDTQWGEHADRYLLRVFGDSVFHQVDDEGRPVIDFAQLVLALNKLDVGHPARVMLSGRHDGSLLLVSYRDLKAVLDKSFGEVVASVPDQGQ